MGGTHTLTTNQTGGANLSFAGNITDNGSAFGIIKAGGASLVLSGTNSFSGGTTINAST